HDIGVPPNSENTSDWDGTGAPQPILGNPAETFLLSEDRKSTRLNSSHGSISYAVFCLKKKTIAHREGPIVLALEVHPHEHLADEAQRQELHPRQPGHRAEQEQRVGRHNRAAEELPHGQ